MLEEPIRLWRPVPRSRSSSPSNKSDDDDDDDDDEAATPESIRFALNVNDVDAKQKVPRIHSLNKLTHEQRKSVCDNNNIINNIYPFNT